MWKREPVPHSCPYGKAVLTLAGVSRSLDVSKAQLQRLPRLGPVLWKADLLGQKGAQETQQLCSSHYG